MSVVLTEPSLPPSWRASGYARLQPAATTGGAADWPAVWRGVAAVLAQARSWDALPADRYLRDGGRYRFRRHACFIHDLAAGALVAAPRRAHWQSTRYNALHGGIERWFEPIEPALAADPGFRALLRALGDAFSNVRPVLRWYVEAHQFRIDSADGIGRPTPEGAHRDGVDFVAILLLRRDPLRGGETRVFPAEGSGSGPRFTMRRPGEMLLLDDARVIHETTPIQPLAAEGRGVRDTLVLTWRAAGFQGPEDASAQSLL